MWIQAKNKQETLSEKTETTSEDSDNQLDHSVKEKDAGSEDSEQEMGAIFSGNKFTALDISD